MLRIYRVIVVVCYSSLTLCFTYANTTEKPKKVEVGNKTVPIENEVFQALVWRNIGPYRGGRVTAVAGHKDQLFTYYMGTTGGGVWKTNDAGNTWRNISDGFFTSSSVGAISVSVSDPNVIYVGMGESPVRGVKSSHGDGIYKSVDAGRTWKHLGLQLTRHIAKICIHPRNPNIVYVAAQGTPFGKTNERGVYKSIDGGETWKIVLFINQTTGANDICIDDNNPDVLYVAMWDHYRYPWQIRSGGVGSSIHKTADGGKTWSKLVNGFPSDIGKIGIAVSPANSDRVFAIVESEKGGLYRSDNGGKNWLLLNQERIIRTRSWYYMHIFADPQDDETVYVLNAPLMKSTDGGRTFTRIRTPHIDNHDLWINPLNNKVMIEGNDGGANISFNGGATWSTQMNQATGQFYRVNTDNQFLYRVYGGLQDHSTVAILSKTRHDGIGRKDWFSCGGAENSSIAFDPNDPNLIYATGGRQTEYDVKNETIRNIGVYPNFDLAINGEHLKYRFDWNTPILLSRHNNQVLYTAAQMVLKSPNRGKDWIEISTDLTLNQKDKQGFGGVPFTNEGAGGELYNTISYLTECPHNKGTLWVGTNDGLVHVTHDDGATWSNATPAGLGEAIINSIEVSPHDPNTVYLSILKHKFNDLKPYIYKSVDGGKSWENATNGIKSEDYVRVVREDPIRKGLLFAGTFSGVYISFNGGDQWKFLDLNLPVVPITDLKIQNNDLVAATEGRAFWILDDYSPLRELVKSGYGTKSYLYKPSEAYLLSLKDEGEEITAPNPPYGALIYFNLNPGLNIDTCNAQILVLNSNNQIINRITLDKSKLRKGLNRSVWNLRMEERKVKSGYFYYPGYQGIAVTPGVYSVKLIINNDEFVQSLMVNPDPQFTPTDCYSKQREVLEKAFSSLNEMHSLLNVAQDIRVQLTDFIKRNENNLTLAELINSIKTISSRIDSIECKITQPKQTTIQDVINYRSQIDTQFGYLIEQIDEAGMNIVYGAERKLQELEGDWNCIKKSLMEIIDKDIPRLNSSINELEVPFIVVKQDLTN
ncbi:MAG: glycosyl hydrolase [Bacteroidales bacterium]|nr:MAG: glycosyl hydrolase [Bacteroidales bacterium]